MMTAFKGWSFWKLSRCAPAMPCTLSMATCGPLLLMQKASPYCHLRLCFTSTLPILSSRVLAVYMKMHCALKGPECTLGPLPPLPFALQLSSMLSFEVSKLSLLGRIDSFCPALNKTDVYCVFVLLAKAEDCPIDSLFLTAEDLVLPL